MSFPRREREFSGKHRLVLLAALCLAAGWPRGGTVAEEASNILPGANGSARRPTRPLPPGQVASPWADVQRSISAVRIDKAPVIDGRLDEDVWILGVDGGPLVQADPYQGCEPSQRTAFRVLYDETHIYVGFWCYDTKPDAIVAIEMARDGRIDGDDTVQFVIDTFHDKRNGYLFGVNPNGARRDALITNNIYLNESWDGIWSAAATIDSEGWKAELAIPFSTVSFNPKGDTWGLNIYRQVKRLTEKNRWTAARPEISTFNVAEAGDLKGLVGLKQGIGLDVTPYALGRYRYDHDSSGSDLGGDVGGDLRYRITPNLTALLSVNTDFAETEVDLRQVNLTRFPLFYPEKRDFFLEDTGIFRFGGLETELIPFYSRRMGLSEDGEQVPILLATKVTGRQSDYNVGFVDAVIDSHDGVNVRNTLVGRISRNVLEQSSVGIIGTLGDPNSESENALAGADFGYRTTRLLGGEVLQANLFGLGSYSEDSGNDDPWAFGGDISLPNDLYSARLQFYQVGQEFRPALGFAPRTGVRAYTGSLGWKPRPAWPEFFRQLFFTTANVDFTDLSNELDTAYHSIQPFGAEFESGDFAWVNLAAQYDSPDEDFEIDPGVIIPAGGYWWTYVRTGVDTTSKRPVELELFYTYGSFYDGSKSSYYAQVDLKPWKRLTFRLAYSVNQVRLPEGDFDTHLASGKMQISFSPSLIWYHLLQYDNQSESFGYNSRIVWEFRPGAYVYLVLNQNIAAEGWDLRLRESELIGKVSVTFRF